MATTACLLSVTVGVWYSRKRLRRQPESQLDSDQFPGQPTMHDPPLIPLGQNVFVTCRAPASSMDALHTTGSQEYVAPDRTQHGAWLCMVSIWLPVLNVVLLLDSPEKAQLFSF